MLCVIFWISGRSVLRCSFWLFCSAALWGVHLKILSFSDAGVAGFLASFDLVLGGRFFWSCSESMSRRLRFWVCCCLMCLLRVIVGCF